MSYLNTSLLESLDAESFQATKPFPWINPVGMLTEDGFRVLRETLPPVSLFTKTINVERGYGQKPHDRYELKYKKELPIAPQWHEFLAELSGDSYRRMLARLLGTKNFQLRFQWQYSFAGCSVSPHCDSENKLGSQIFYFNTPEDWKEGWGGKTLILDDGGKFNCNSAPELSDFPSPIEAETFGNRSLLFMRTPHSWHAVGELTSPEGALRKIFTIVIDKDPTITERAVRKISTFLRLRR